MTSITTEEAERLAGAHDAGGKMYRRDNILSAMHYSTANAIRSLTAERDALRAEVKRLKAGGCARDQTTTQFCAEAAALQAENARLREALTNAAAVIGSFYAFAETADAVSISGIARCHAMLTSMKKNRRRIEETVMAPARAALGEKE